METKLVGRIYNQKVYLIFLILGLTLILNTGAVGNSITKDNLAELHEKVCDQNAGNDDPWNLRKLYNCQTKTFFIPYQLWTGSKWNGDKKAPCMHKADILFNANNGKSETTIEGPIEWVNPKSGKTIKVWKREKTRSRKKQLFSCHEKGIGRVFDSRKKSTRGFYQVGRCKFPAGFSWIIGKRRSCLETSIEIISIDVDRDNNLESMEFKWWSRSQLSNSYVYTPNNSMRSSYTY